MKTFDYLILGSNSFSGSSFVNFLLNKNKKVLGLSRSKELDKLFDVGFTDKMKNDFQLIKHLLGSKNSSEVIAKKIIDVI